jgi:hypothetical protein
LILISLIYSRQWIPNFSRCNPGSTPILRHMGNR